MSFIVVLLGSSITFGLFTQKQCSSSVVVICDFGLECHLLLFCWVAQLLLVCSRRSSVVVV